MRSSNSFVRKRTLVFRPAPGLPIATLTSVADPLMHAPLGRRDFLRSLASAFAIAAFPRAAEPERFLIGTVSHANARAFHDGVALGSEEASRAARLFGRARIQIARSEAAPSARDAAAALIRNRTTVILGALGDHDTMDVAADCDAARVVFLNCTARADSLRRNLCSRFVFHVEASEAMYTAAAAAAGASRIALWSSSLEKYGAAQLNDRFRSKFRYPMDSSAWAGWFGVKAIWESMLRARGSATLEEGLASVKSQFDGHKGAPLSFRNWDHQLRQPLYALSSLSGSRPLDIPDLTGSAPVRDLLDSIGDPANRPGCREFR